MAHITANDNYITVRCPECGQEVKVDITSGLGMGATSWYYYQCQHCGHNGEVEISLGNRTYSLDEILEMNKKQKSIQEENSLTRIANALEDIRDIFKELLDNDK